MRFRKRGLLLFLGFLFSIFLISSSVFALENNQTYIQEDAELALENIIKIGIEMGEANFNTTRINDTYEEAYSIYEAQELRKRRGGNPDYELVVNYYEEVSQMKEDAFQARDEIFSLEKSLEPLKEKGVDISEAEEIIGQVKKEISDERYEQALELISDATDKIAEIEASSTVIRVFYSSTRRGIVNFFKEHYLAIGIVILASVISYFLFKKRVIKHFINGNILRLKIEKQTLKKLIRKTQEQYFEDGEISEGVYNVRISKFSELIRDIDRQLPLLQEQLAKVEKKVGVRKTESELWDVKPFKEKKFKKIEKKLRREIRKKHKKRRPKVGFFGNIKLHLNDLKLKRVEKKIHKKRGKQIKKFKYISKKKFKRKLRRQKVYKR